MKAILQLVELMSGLKINFHKSVLVGIKVNSPWLEDATHVLDCKVGSFPY
jgi:hypothetical protein